MRPNANRQQMAACCEIPKFRPNLQNKIIFSTTYLVIAFAWQTFLLWDNDSPVCYQQKWEQKWTRHKRPKWNTKNTLLVPIPIPFLSANAKMQKMPLMRTQCSALPIPVPTRQTEVTALREEQWWQSIKKLVAFFHTSCLEKKTR